MADYGRTIHLRLDRDKDEKLVELHKRHYAGLSRTAVLRFLVNRMLSLPEAELVAWIAEGIRAGTPEEPEGMRFSRSATLNTHQRNRKGLKP